ncbi:AAA family ATPase [bacterium]|nr:AAA family ATPase [bacterium]
MLRRIEVRDFSLLREVRLELGTGLTVLTGASGAGKSLLFDAVGFALGGRPHRSLLAEGAKHCEVTLELELSDAVAKALGEPWRTGANLLSRRMSENGRSRLKLNGATVQLGPVAAAGERLFEITGQFESRVLFNAAVHLELLDAFGDAKLPGLLADYQREYKRWRELEQLLREARRSSSQREQEIDFLRFSVDELAKAAVAAGERSEVEGRLKLQQNARGLVEAAATAARLLDGDDDATGAYDLAAQAEQQIAELDRLLAGTEVEFCDPEDLASQAEGLLTGLRELAGSLRDIAESIQHDPAELKRLSERLDEILRLERKYSVAADELPALLTEKEQRLELLTGETYSPEVLAEQAAAALKQLKKLGGELAASRKKAAAKLEKNTAKYFQQLEFPHVELQVDRAPLPEPGPAGLDAAEFMISLNPGEPARPLARVASGGETSRLMLGLKAALAEQLGHQVLLLDEIEAGIGGETAKAIAEVLTGLAGRCQVLAITHLASVAVHGATHLVAEKSVAAQRTSVSIAPVADGARRVELTRMLGETGGAEEQALVDKLLSEAKG